MKKNSLLLLLFFFVALGLNAQTPRLSLYEEFTGENCPPCAGTNPDLNDTLSLPANFAKMVAIKWQVPIPSAPTKTWSLYQTNKTEIDWRWTSGGYGYNPAINSAPSSKIDGQEATVFGAPSGHPANLNSTIIATAQSYTSAFSISMTRAWNKTSTAVNLTITITATAPFTATGPLVFRTVMVERLIQFSVMPGTNGETKFEDVVIKSFPTLQQGVAMASTWTLGQTQTFTLNCTLPAYTRKKDQVAFVGFIQDDGNRKVMQAMRVNPAPIPQVALSGISAQVDLTCTNLITPTVEIKNESITGAITALTLTPYIDGIAGSITPWTGNLAAGATTIVTLNSVSSPAISGSHTFSCDIDIASTFYNLIKNNTQLSYMASSNYQGTAVVEGFTTSVYPPTGFGVVNADNGPSWSRSNVAGGYNTSTESSKYNFYNNTVIGDKDELYLPPMNLSAAPNPYLSFDIAYAQRNPNSNDGLDILVSTNCGTTWTTVYTKYGTSLATTAATGYAYTPDSSDPTHWRTDGVDLSAFLQAQVLVKFVTTSDNGNNLYLDNINLALITGLKNYGTSAANVNLYPNPTNGITKLELNNIKAGDAKVSVVNTLGQVVYLKHLVLTEGANTVQLDLKDFSTGIYNVTIETKNEYLVKKLALTK